MDLLVATVHRYPVVLLVVGLVAIALCAYAADWFVGLVERDDQTGPR